MSKQQVMVRDDDEETVSGLPVGYEANGSLAVSLARAEIDQQIVTARAMPRSIAKAVQNITTLATLDDASAEECLYALPRAGKAIKGPSIRLAEIIAACWGNCRVGARVVHVDRFEKFVEAEGVFHDLETNTATTSRVRRRISNKRGELLQEDMIVVTGNAACAIAKRNAVLGAVPKAVWRKAYEAVEAVVAGDIKTLAERRDKAIKAFATVGVTPEQIFVALGVGGLDDIGLEHLSTLTASRSAIKNGEATVEEIFPKIDPKQPKQTLRENLDALAADKPAHDPETGEIVADKQIHGSAAGASEAAAGPEGEARVAPVASPNGPGAAQDGPAGGAATTTATAPAKAATDGPKDAKAAPKDDPLLAEGADAAERGTPILRVFLQRVEKDGDGAAIKRFGQRTLDGWFRLAAKADAAIAEEEGAEQAT